MWRIDEHRRIDKDVSGRIPVEVPKWYGKWKDISALSGPAGLRAINGFRGEALSGKWSGYRASRLNEQWRIVYQIVADAFLAQVVRVTPHDYRSGDMKEFRPAMRRIEVSVGESGRIVRELQELSQNKLAATTGIPQSTLSAIENGRVNLGVGRGKTLARALHCHPAVLVFSGWPMPVDSAA